MTKLFVHISIPHHAQVSYVTHFQGRIQDFWKGVHMYKGVCVWRGVTLQIVSNFSYISHEHEIIWSH